MWKRILAVVRNIEKEIRKREIIICVSRASKPGAHRFQSLVPTSWRMDPLSATRILTHIHVDTHRRRLNRTNVQNGRALAVYTVSRLQSVRLSPALRLRITKTTTTKTFGGCGDTRFHLAGSSTRDLGIHRTTRRAVSRATEAAFRFGERTERGRTVRKTSEPDDNRASSHILSAPGTRVTSTTSRRRRRRWGRTVKNERERSG